MMISRPASARMWKASSHVSARVLLAVFCLLGCLFVPRVFGESFAGNDPFAAEDEFLPVEEAFVLTSTVVDGDTLLVRWVMPEGYYLYRHRFGFKTREGSPLLLGEPVIPAGKAKEDEYFGAVEVYYHEAEIRVPLLGAIDVQEVGVEYQGCADAGLCYPPETRWVLLAAAVETEDQGFVRMLGEGSTASTLLLFLLAGIGLAFTPCVLPMVPILSSIIVGEGPAISRGRAFTLSLTYVLGMAVTYALVGTLVGLFGAELNLQARLQSPPVLIFFAVVFVLLAFAMFGFYEFALPAGLQDRLQRLAPAQSGGKHLSVLIMGAVSSLVVSPCVSAPLAGALVYISQTENAVLGGSALLALGLGMGVPLLILGAGGGGLLPRAGAWMDSVKAVFGVLLLAVAIWLVERVVSPAINLALWAVLLIGSGVWLGALDSDARSGESRTWKAAGVIMLIYGVLLLIGAASGATDPLRPLAQLGSGGSGAADETETDAQHWRPVDSLGDLAREMDAAAGKFVILDLYADWCISCKVMERRVFPHPEVAPLLARFHLTRADITADLPQHREMLEKYGLFGPPSLVFFGPGTEELTAVRIQGEVNADQLRDHLTRVLGSSSI
ncbi:MAG: protein-disulfide reductase DsbD [Gammaproteobacteria bacterium]|nr:protein-disulfide reductase DsbD [Gammaproteobacteria bacterium]